MQNIITACDPREDILGGTFNPEIFTASLNEVIQYYQTNQHGIHPIYTDAVQFFTEGTYATDGFKMVLNEVFARLAGDGMAPAIHRLETAFGGGKTHTLIACTHIGNMGDEIRDCLDGLVDPPYIPGKGDIHVVGISGIDIPVHKPRGTRLIPYTLWGEIAFQIGGETLYQKVAEEATSKAAPGSHYFETVFENRSVLLMIDELAQYAARLSAVGSGEEEQLAAFLLKLHDYARSRTGSGDLLILLNADVGGADTDSLNGGSSNAEEADRRNPHPEGYPLYECTWKTIFLDSLVGRNQGLKSGRYGP